MELHLTATGCHLPYEIKQCHLPLDTSDHTPPGDLNRVLVCLAERVFT